MFYVTYIADTFLPLFTWIPFTGVKGTFLYLVLRSFKIRNYYIVANLIVVVHSAEDCYASSMKFLVPKKVVLFIVYLSIILTLFILNTLFDKNYTRISHIYFRNLEHCYFLPIISMQKVNLNYSTKNIPIPSARSYLPKLTEKIELAIKRMRWKAI